MSIDDYNRGYQAGWSGISTGPPRSAAELAGYWNGQQAQRIPQSQGSVAYVGDGGGNGHLVIAALVSGAAFGLYTRSFLGGLAGAVAGWFAMAALTALVVRAFGILAWIYRPIPKMKVALLCGTAGVVAHWGLAAYIPSLWRFSPASAGVDAALAGLLLAGSARVAVAPFAYLARRS